MWNVITQAGVASAVVDFTDDLSLLLVGLVSCVWLSVGAIVVLALRDSLSGKTLLVSPPRSVSEGRQEAA